MTDPYTILRAFVAAYHGDAIADSDLDDEQPRTITVTLGDIRRAQRAIDASERVTQDARRYRLHCRNSQTAAWMNCPSLFTDPDKALAELDERIDNAIAVQERT